MKEVFKFSTVLGKIVIISLIFAAIIVTTKKAFAKTENEKIVFQAVRVSLWYEGAQDKVLAKREQNARPAVYPEELFRALQKDQEQVRGGFKVRKK